MNPVGNMRNGVFLMGNLRPKLSLHLSRHPAVYGADPVMKAGTTQGQAGHIEALPGVQPQLIKLLEIQTQGFSDTGQVLGNQLHIKDIVPRRHRRMRGKYCTGRHQLHGTAEIQTLAHAISTALQ